MTWSESLTGYSGRSVENGLESAKTGSRRMTLKASAVTGVIRQRSGCWKGEESKMRYTRGNSTEHGRCQSSYSRMHFYFPQNIVKHVRVGMNRREILNEHQFPPIYFSPSSERCFWALSPPRPPHSTHTQGGFSIPFSF